MSDRKAQNISLIPIFLIGLLILNVLQGYFTEILEDEAYYWVYSQFMDWGYFDHPPMTAVWIQISQFFFPNGELSVRFFSAITLTATYFFTWKIIQKENPKYNIRDFKSNALFILLVLSTAMVGVYGFVTVPDTPLIFFSTLLLYGYRQYLDKKSLLSYFIISVSMAAMLYSKYHGVLIIFFILISNLRLLRDYKIWIASIVSLALFFPHIYWQISSDYPSIRYHLSERINEAYRIDFTATHLLNMMAIIGFTFPIVYLAFFKNIKNKNPFQRSLNFIVGGFLIFFFLMSFRGHIQAQWIVPISIPLIIITFSYLLHNPKHQKTFITLALITIGVTIYLRFAMIFGGLLPKQFHMHGNKKWVQNVQQVIEGRKPLFLDSYQNTSTYWFYSGQQPYQYNAFNKRKNHFSLLKKEFECPEKTDVAHISITPDSHAITLKKRNTDSLYIQFIDDYIGINRLEYQLNQPMLKNDISDEKLKVTIHNPYKRHISLDSFETLIVLYAKDRSIINWIDCKTVLTNGSSSLTPGSHSASLLFNKKDFKANTHSIGVIGKNNPKTSFFRMSKKVDLVE